jgi:hypothetical protein
MSATVTETVAGVFASAEQANRAVDELKRAGLRDEEIGVVPGRAEGGEGPGCRSESGVTVGTGAGAGLLAGAALGGLAGGLPGMVAAGVAGGLLGTFIDLGIPEDAACFYRDETEAGRTVVLVRSAGRSAEVADLLRRHGAQEVRLTAASAGPES